MEQNRNSIVFKTSTKGVTYQLRSYKDEIEEESRLFQEHHKHFFIEFHYIYEGEERIRLPGEGRDIVLSAGEFGIVPQGVYHGAKNDLPVTRFCFHLSLEYDEAPDAAECEEQYRVHRLLKSIRHFLVIRDETLTGLMNLYREWTSEGLLLSENRKGTLLFCVLSALLCRIEQSEQIVGIAEPQEKDPAVFRQKWIMEEYFDNSFASSEGIEGLAKRLYLSERRTRTLVKEYFGKNFKEIIVRERMELADVLLRDSALSLDEIAVRVGYCSYSGFYLAFLHYWGMPPNEVREKMAKK